MTAGSILLAVFVALALAGRVQAVLLSRRIDRVVQSGTIDPGSGMYVAAAGRVRLQAEVSRGRRTGTAIDLRRGTVAGGAGGAAAVAATDADAGADLDARLRSVAAALPSGSIAVRVGAAGWGAAVPDVDAGATTMAESAAPGERVALVGADADAGDVRAAIDRVLDAAGATA